MNNGGDAAEQIVRLSLEGFEVAVRLTGSAAKNIAILLASVLKQEISQSNKTRGKARLTNMIKSGKELKVFSFQQKDLPKFTEQAKRYGVLYCVLRDKNTKSDTAMVDIIARAEDAAKIQRISDRFELGKVDKASIVSEAEKDVADREAAANEVPTKSRGEIIVRKRWESQCRRREIPTKTPRSQRRTKALCPSETQKRQVRTLIRVSQRRRIRSLRSGKSSTDTRRLPKRKRKQSVLCRRLLKRSRKPPKPIGRPFTGSRRNPRSRKRGERNGSTEGTSADRGAVRHAR